MLNIYVVNLTLYVLIWAQQEQSKVDSGRIVIIIIIISISGVRIRENKCREQSFTFNKWQSLLKPWGFYLESLYTSPTPNEMKRTPVLKSHLQLDSICSSSTFWLCGSTSLSLCFSSVNGKQEDLLWKLVRWNSDHDRSILALSRCTIMVSSYYCMKNQLDSWPLEGWHQVLRWKSFWQICK